ncbi:cache domain-containing sensor histidine kinase [Paenibacillus glycanilyticus]|uniref:Histidine kinase n=1 Tax=Paenibacillus glycanilyticus TaxID=126569 RepID=A0ABQ6GPK7_9BACL|nr:sensor histidine kinase [Paenibacillus glycanilyticus]GLX71522.1 histidine kinase [Paenibacillus glycanilyticus]
MKRLLGLKDKRMSFGFKLMISYLVFALTPTAVVGMIAYQSSVHSIKEQTRVNLSGTLEQMRDNIDYKSSEIKRSSDQLFYDLTVQKLLRTYKEGWTSYDSLQNYMLPTLQNIMLRASGKLQVRLYLAEESFPEIYGELDSRNDPLNENNRFDIYHLSRIEDESWYKDLPWQANPDAIEPKVYRGEEYVWSQVENDGEFGNVSMIRRLVDFDKGKTFGILRIMVKVDALLEAADYRKLGDSSTLSVEDSEGKTMRLSGVTDNNFGETAGRQTFTIQDVLPGLGWKIIASLPQSVLEKDARHVRNLTLLVCFISTIVLIAIGIVISRYFSNGVKRVIASLNAFRSGDFGSRMEIHGADEFAQIARAFNKMSKDIDLLIQEVYLANIEKKEAELETLQAQINPHFLYNTLSSISRLAKMGEIDRLHDMVMGLAKFYRLTLNEGKTHIPVTKELEQAITYLEIQKIKHRDRIQVWYDIEPSVYGYETIKIILQPFLENALQHAFFEDEMSLKLMARREGDLIVFGIVDDGVGMSKEQLRQINDPNGVKIGYGVRNVDERIKLQYGQAYGVEFGGGQGIGTSVRITVPAIRIGGRNA